MNLSRDAILALQRHFLGALSAPARTWLEPLPSSALVFAGSAIRPAHGGCVLDLGSVASPGQERSLVRVCSRARRVDVRLGELPPWLTARWADDGGAAVSLGGGNGGAVLEVCAAHDAEREFRGALRFDVGDRVEELQVRMTARRAHPHAWFGFNGWPEARPFEFGSEEDLYELSIANATAVPLVVAFSDLPAFLRFEVDGRHRSGPIDGPFFERAAPFSVTLRPRLPGRHEGSLRVRTNDPRPELQHFHLRFGSSLAAPAERTKPAVRTVPATRTPTRRVVRPETVAAAVALLLLTLLFVISRGFP